MSLDCVHRWMSKCWSVQLQWHILTDPSHQSFEPKKGPPKPPERFSDLVIAQITLLCDGLLTSTLWSEVKGRRGGHVSLFTRLNSISCLLGLSMSGPLQFIAKGDCSQYAVLLQAWRLTLQLDCWHPPFTAAIGSIHVHKCSCRIYTYLAQSKKFFLLKHRNQCCPFTYICQKS